MCDRSTPVGAASKAWCVHELYNGQFSSNQWVDTDLTLKAVNGVPPLTGSALDAYTDGSGEHVIFIGANDGHVHELYNGQFSSNQWTDTDLTLKAVNGVPPLTGSALAGYSDGSGEHVNFIDGGGHVHELYNGEFSAGQWTDNDLSHAANAANPVSAFFGSPLAGYTDGSGEHVNFIATDGDVHQLYNGPSGQWTDIDLIGTGGFGAPGSNGTSLAAYSDGSGQHVFYTVKNFIVGNADVYELLS
jgi:hypothetical protein